MVKNRYINYFNYQLRSMYPLNSNNTTIYYISIGILSPLWGSVWTINLSNSLKQMELAVSLLLVRYTKRVVYLFQVQLTIWELLSRTWPDCDSFSPVSTTAVWAGSISNFSASFSRCFKTVLISVGVSIPRRIVSYPTETPVDQRIKLLHYKNNMYFILYFKITFLGHFLKKRPAIALLLSFTKTRKWCFLNFNIIHFIYH